MTVTYEHCSVWTNVIKLIVGWTFFHLLLNDIHLFILLDRFSFDSWWYQKSGTQNLKIEHMGPIRSSRKTGTVESDPIGGCIQACSDM